MQNFDGIRSLPSEHISIVQAARFGMNGGTMAIDFWAVPLAVAILTAALMPLILKKPPTNLPS